MKGAVIKAVNQLDADKAAKELKSKGTVTVTLNGEETELPEEDLLVEIKQVEGFEALSDNGITVVMDKHLTPELIEEGFVRELISKIQTMRKEAGFEVMDRIKVYADGNEKIRDILAANKAQIMHDVLADDIIYGETKGYTKDWKINTEAVTLGVEKQ